MYLDLLEYVLLVQIYPTLPLIIRYKWLLVPSSSLKRWPYVKEVIYSSRAETHNI